jgi:BON domain
MRPVLHFAVIFVLSSAYAFAQSDEEIQTAVQKAIPETTIHASVQNGAVILTGFVDLYRDRLLADETVSRIHGVKTIQDGITVAGPQVPDTQLKPAIDEIIADRIRNLGTFGAGWCGNAFRKSHPTARRIGDRYNCWHHGSEERHQSCSPGSSLRQRTLAIIRSTLAWELTWLYRTGSGSPQACRIRHQRFFFPCSRSSRNSFSASALLWSSCFAL